MDIAIIGSGMAGLATARILKDAGHTVTIFEALSGRGMDSHSIEFEGGVIDAPLRVMNPYLWKNTLSLATHLGMKMFPVRTYMACSWLFEDRTETWLTTNRSRIGNFPIINNKKGIQQYGWRLVKGMLQLKTAINQFFKSKQQDITLAEFINQNHIEEVFWHGAVMPVLYTICTCNPKTIGEWPAKPLLTFLRQLTDGDALLRMQGGTPAFVDRLIDGVDIRSGSAITQVEQQGEKVKVVNTQGEQGLYDRVIVATPTSKVEEFLNAEQFADDIAILKQFRFEDGDLVIHTDTSVMPPRRKDWSVLSYMMDRKFTRQQFTVWMNAVEPTLVGKNPVFQTWRPVTEIDPKKIISTVKLTRAVVDSKTVALNKELQQRHKMPNRKVFFCGSWSCDGLPILESAVTSAMHIAEIFNAPLPFVGLTPKVEVAPQLGY
ncbi:MULTISPECIES: FAD-dependent oxidoreductase [Acinetobacter]|uniref:FAD-dependent oxidoreductase n=1 Tax=Acinetobacter TaxID=469 RepID=UPI00044F1232|nr:MULTISPECIES: FAD-dependent oxidoreductase [Acinetobacter]MEC8057379.1 FAD-dependent oxidoreductase [Pseudomonadota bacterium]EXD37254.1 pyridine nucleotide-disulfide oxidoreductase family protein [Acinetobacter sp. 479375]MCU4306269.1 FAD-dependent oxidoreductase [Acinetobacter ursingii]MCU4371810.1 FAD-dependent oxidoreductase [Acinetobacter ursingii]MCU4483198.1 FAD-dependent oxidoreductase [Acinetobacter ursingii]